MPQPRIAAEGKAEMLEDELELICWRANTQCWDAAERHTVS